MKRNHLTHCLVGIGGAVALLLAVGVRVDTMVYVGAALACPLMMILMMRGMMHGRVDRPEHKSSQQESAAPQQVVDGTR